MTVFTTVFAFGIGFFLGRVPRCARVGLFGVPRKSAPFLRSRAARFGTASPRLQSLTRAGHLLENMQVVAFEV